MGLKEIYDLEWNHIFSWDDFSYWEASQGGYSATISVSKFRHNRKSMANVYQGKDVIFDRDYSSFENAKKGVNEFLNSLS